MFEAAARMRLSMTHYSKRSDTRHEGDSGDMRHEAHTCCNRRRKETEDDDKGEQHCGVDGMNTAAATIHK